MNDDFKLIIWNQFGASINMRHVQHHAGQLNLILRQSIDSAPRWGFKSKKNY